VKLVFFTDRDLGKRFPAILVDAGLQVERHHDLFPPDGRDEQWLEYCGHNGRIAVSHDQRIRHKVNELDAVIRHRVALLIVIGKAPYPDLARHFVASLRKIEEFVRSHRPPYVAKVYRPTPKALQLDPSAEGDVTLWYPV
jgi:hypothetical protein